MKATALVDEEGNITWFLTRQQEELMSAMTDEQKAQYLLDLERERIQMERIEAERIKKESWSHRTGFNPMCYKCPLLKGKCMGSKNHTWTGCASREVYEREKEKAATRWIRSGKRQKGI